MREGDCRALRVTRAVRDLSRTVPCYVMSTPLQRSMEKTRDFLRQHGEILFADHCQSYLLLS